MLLLEELLAQARAPIKEELEEKELVVVAARLTQSKYVLFKQLLPMNLCFLELPPKRMLP